MYEMKQLRNSNVIKENVKVETLTSYKKFVKVELLI